MVDSLNTKKATIKLNDNYSLYVEIYKQTDRSYLYSIIYEYYWNKKEYLRQGKLGFIKKSYSNIIYEEIYN